MGFRNLMQPRGSVVAVANQDAYIQLQNGVQTIRLLVTLFATLTIAVAPAAATVGRGSLSQCVRLALIDAGQDRVRAEGKGLRYIAEAFAPSALTEVRQTAVAAAAYPLISQFPIWFSSPYAANPMEAAFLENDPSTVLQFAVFLKSATPATFLTTVGGGGNTNTLGALTARVVQEAQVSRDSLPYYIPTIREVSIPVTAASGLFEFPLTAKLNRLRGVLLTQDTNVGTVIDIISGGGAANVGGVSLLGDNGQIIGPALMNVDQLAQSSETEFGGNVYPATDANALAPQNAANILFHFQKWGRLSNLLDPRQYINLRFVLNVTPSVTAGATTSTLRATLLEMETPPAQGARQLVAPLPASLM